MSKKEYKKIVEILGIIVVQTIIILWLTSNISLRNLDENQIPEIAVRIPAIIAIVFVPVCFALIKRLIGLVKAEADSELYKLELEKSQELITSLRAQRHDFCTYLNVIMGFIQLEKRARAIEYITDVAMSLRYSDRNMIFREHSILSALFVTKSSIAVKAGIEFSLNIQTDLEDVDLVEHKLSRILGNIIDNAMDALKEVDISPKRLDVIIKQKGNNIEFIIWNNGPEIPRQKLMRIFDEGYSTKGTEGRGMGLHIAMNLVKEIDGSISVTSGAEDGTEFKVIVPFNSIKKGDIIDLPSV